MSETNLVPITHANGNTPQVVLRNVAADFPDATAVAVVVYKEDGRVIVEWSNATTEQLVFMQRVFDERMTTVMREDEESQL